VNIRTGDRSEVWGKAYPEEYELWKKTPRAVACAGASTDRDGRGAVSVDKLFRVSLHGASLQWLGFRVEYNRAPRACLHGADQLDIDAQRIGAGGVCLSCKSPYAVSLQKEMGVEYFRKAFGEVLAKIPEKNRELGVACIDCHDNKDLGLRISEDLRC